MTELIKINQDVYVPVGTVLADGMASAIIGHRQEENSARAIYSFYGCVQALMDLNTWDYDTAIEWMDFNVVGANAGPIFLYLDECDD